jgi:LemA protein
MKFEQDTLEKVMQARAQVSAARSRDIPALGSAKARAASGFGTIRGRREPP